MSTDDPLVLVSGGRYSKVLRLSQRHCGHDMLSATLNTQHADKKWLAFVSSVRAEYVCTQETEMWLKALQGH